MVRYGTTNRTDVHSPLLLPVPRDAPRAHSVLRTGSLSTTASHTIRWDGHLAKSPTGRNGLLSPRESSRTKRNENLAAQPHC